MHNNFIDTTWSDGANPSSIIKFTHSSAILDGPYWEQFGGTGTYNSASNSEKIIISTPKKLELILYTDGRLIVQEKTTHFFSRLP